MPSHGLNPNGPLTILSHGESVRILDQCFRSQDSRTEGHMVGSISDVSAMLPSGGTNPPRPYSSYVPRLLIGLAFVLSLGWIWLYGHTWAVDHTEIETFIPDDYVELLLGILRKIGLMG